MTPRLSINTWYGGLAPWGRVSRSLHFVNIRFGALGRRVGIFWRRA